MPSERSSISTISEVSAPPSWRKPTSTKLITYMLQKNSGSTFGNAYHLRGVQFKTRFSFTSPLNSCSGIEVVNNDEGQRRGEGKTSLPTEPEKLKLQHLQVKPGYLIVTKLGPNCPNRISSYMIYQKKEKYADRLKSAMIQSQTPCEVMRIQFKK